MDWRITAVKVIGSFLTLFLWPARLSADYSYNAVPLFSWSANWEDAKALIAMALCLGAALLIPILAVRARRAAKPALFFLAFSLVAMLPTSNLIVLIGSIMAERFVYLPSVGLAGIVVAAIYALVWRNPHWRPETARVAWAALGAACLALAARTYARNLDWKDDLSLWTSAVNVSPGSAKAHYNLGKALETLPSRLPEAIAEYQASLRIDPNHGDVHDNLANALSRMPGRLPQAIAHYQAALRLQPDRPEVHNDWANALANIPGRLPEAIDEYRAALRILPDSAELHYNLANVLLRQPGELSAAVDEYRAALRIDPAHADRTSIWETHWRDYPAGCRRRSPNTGSHSAFNLTPQARTSPSQTRYPPPPTDSRKRSPNTDGRCRFGPMQKPTMTWEPPWRASPTGCRRRLRSLNRPCKRSPTFRRRL